MSNLRWLDVADVIELSRAETCTDARMLLQSKYPKNTDHHEEALEKLRDDYESPPLMEAYVPRKVDPHRGNFIAVAFMMGASLGQLAVFCDIKRPTVYELVRRRLPNKDERNNDRAQRRLTYEGIGVISNMYYSLMRTQPHLAQADVMTQAKETERVVEFDDTLVEDVSS